MSTTVGDGRQRRPSTTNVQDEADTAEQETRFSAWYQLPQRTRAILIGVLTTASLILVLIIISSASPNTSAASLLETLLIGGLILSVAVRLVQSVCSNRDPNGTGGDAATNRRLLRQLLRHGLAAAGGGRAAMLLATVDRDFDEGDYQSLLALDENTPTQQLARAHASEVRALPEVTLPASWQASDALAEDQRSCSICLSTYEGGDAQRILPCFHRFHSACVDRWLTQGRAECPICKTSIRQGGGGGGAHSRSGDVSPTTLQAIEAAEAGQGHLGVLPALHEDEVAGLVAGMSSDEGGAGSDSEGGHLGLGGL